jgi:outer membrane receptor for ferrienterochelin and colicins
VQSATALFLVISTIVCQAALTSPFTADSSRAVGVTDSLRAILSRQIVVTGTRNELRAKDSPVRVEIIGPQRLKNSGLVTMGDVLREQTGLALSGTIRPGIQMNGLGPDHTLILIDGQPVIGRIAGVLDLSRLSVGNVERVEIVKGPMSSMYGSDALAGVINIITKRPNDGVTGNVLMQNLTRGPAEARLELGWGSDSLEVSGFANIKDQPAFTAQGANVAIPVAGFRDATMQTNIQWRASRHWTFRSWLRGFASQTSGAFVESVFGQIAANSGSVDQWDGSATCNAEYRSGRARLNITSYGSVFNERYNFDTVQGSGSSVDDLRRRILRTYAQYDLMFGKKNRMTIGGEYIHDDIAGTRYRDSSGQDPFYRTAVGFVQWEGLPTDYLSYVLSARVDDNNAFGTALSPRLSILWKPGEHVRASAGIGTGFKAPDFRQLFVTFSNRLAGAGYDLIGARRLGIDLRPERSLTYDAGLRYEDGQRRLSGSSSVLYNAEIRAFRNDLSNLIEFFFVRRVDGRDVYSYRNIARAFTQGIETNLHLSLAHDDLGTFSLMAGYQFLDARDQQVLDAIDKGQAGTVNQLLSREAYGGLWGRSRNSGTLRLQYDDPSSRYSINARFQFIGRFGVESLDKNGYVISDPPRKVLDRDDEYVAGYTVINLAGSVNITVLGLQSTVGIGVLNMLNISDPTLIPGLVGRQAYVQVGTKF